MPKSLTACPGRPAFRTASVAACSWDPEVEEIIGRYDEPMVEHVPASQPAPLCGVRRSFLLSEEGLWGTSRSAGSRIYNGATVRDPT